MKVTDKTIISGLLNQE